MSFKIPNVQPFASRPPGFYCYICGKEYGSSSLRLHFKSCIKQWEATENLKSKKDRRPTPTPPQELATIYDMMKRGVRIDPKIIDFYNEKAIRLWEEKFCLKCSSCSRMIPHSLKDSHKKLCITMPHLDTPTESLQEAIVKDFPYEPKNFHLPTSFRHTESTEHSINDSLGKISINKLFDQEQPEKEIALTQCDDCGRKFNNERLDRHKKACNAQLKGQWKHDEMMKKAQAKQLSNLKFHDYEKRYKTHKWKNQHEELSGIFSNQKSAKSSKDITFELIHQDFIECNTCHRQFHPKRINAHSEHCLKTCNKHKGKKLFKQEDKLNPLSKSIKQSNQDVIKGAHSPKIDTTKSKSFLTSTPRFHSATNTPRTACSLIGGGGNKLMPKKPDFVKINLKEIADKVDTPTKQDDKALQSPSNVNTKSISQVRNIRKAGPQFDRKTKTAYLKSSDFVNK